MNDTQAVWATGLGSVRRRLAAADARHADARRKRTAMAVAAHDAGLSYTAIARALGVARQNATTLIENARRDAADDTELAAAIEDAARHASDAEKAADFAAAVAALADELDATL